MRQNQQRRSIRVPLQKANGLIPKSSELKRVRVLEGARKVFLAYGFERATMKDIAVTAGVSRPTLYLEFKDKRHIYRSLVSDLLENEVETITALMAENRRLATRMERSFMSLITLVQQVEEWPHGHALIDIENELVRDIILSARSRVVRIFRKAMETERERNATSWSRAGTSTAALAELLLDAFAGLNRRAASLHKNRKMKTYVHAITCAHFH